MHQCGRWALFVAVLGLVAIPNAGRGFDVASPGSRLSRQSHIPVPPRADDIDPQELLRRQMGRAEGRAELRKLLEELLKNPKRLSIDPDQKLPPADLNNPEVRKLIQQLLTELGKGQLPFQLSEEERRRLQAAWKKAELPPIPSKPPDDPIKPPPKLPLDFQPEPTPEPDPPLPTPVPDPTPPSRDSQEEHDRAALESQVRQWLERLGEMRGPWQNSPTFQRLTRDLARLGLDNNGRWWRSGNGEGLDVQLARLTRQTRELRDWWESQRSTFRGINWPRLPRIDWSPNWNNGAMTWPSVSPRRGVSSPVSGSAVWQGVLWGVVLILLAACLWKVGRWQLASSGRRGEGWRLGPWPVDPASVASREDLVRAFEYLSLLCCGPAARTWNHREIAARLGGNDTERARAATDLATVYERARYAPARESLSETTLAAARRDLCLLAGVAAA